MSNVENGTERVMFYPWPNRLNRARIRALSMCILVVFRFHYFLKISPQIPLLLGVRKQHTYNLTIYKFFPLGVWGTWSSACILYVYATNV